MINPTDWRDKDRNLGFTYSSGKGCFMDCSLPVEMNDLHIGGNYTFQDCLRKFAVSRSGSYIKELSHWYILPRIIALAKDVAK